MAQENTTKNLLHELLSLQVDSGLTLVEPISLRDVLDDVSIDDGYPTGLWNMYEDKFLKLINDYLDNLSPPEVVRLSMNQDPLMKKCNSPGPIQARALASAV